MIAFGAVEIPVGVPAAEQTLNILAKIDQRAQLVVEHIGEVSFATAGAGSRIAPVLNTIGEHADNLGRRFEHLGVMSAFAFTAMANDSERGLTRLAHGIAFLGFAFGPVEGAITTFVAVAGEQLLDFWHKSEAAANKAAEANQKFLDSIGEAKNLKASAERQQQLYSGAEYTTETDPLLRAGIKGGGIQALRAQIDPLRAQYDALQKTVQGLTLENVPKATARAMDDLMAKINPLDERLQVMVAAYEKFSRLTGQLLPGAVSEEAQKDKREAARKALEDKKRSDEEEARLDKDAHDRILADIAAADAKEAKERAEARAEQLKAEDIFYKQLDAEVSQSEAAQRKLREEDLAHQRVVAEKTKELARTTANIIGDTMKGLYSGGITGGFRALGDGILKSLGDILVKIGEKMLAASAIFGPLAEWLAKPFDPGAGVAFAIGGAALIALGSAMGAAGSGGGGGGGYGGSSSYAAQSITNTVTPTYAPNTAGVAARQPITVNVTAFGKHDPTFQRELLEAISVAQRRGSTSG